MIHQDWRTKIHDILRTKRTKLTGDYIQRSLDQFDLLLPRLLSSGEVLMRREDISKLTRGEWSESSVGKFMQHLAKAGVISVRSAGIHGLGITLLKDLTKSPWKRRRDAGEIPTEEAPNRVEESRGTQMPTATPPQYDVPEDADYCTSVDLDLALGALDVVSRDLLGIDLAFAKQFAGAPAAKIYEAQERIMRCVKSLNQIRSAIGAGDDTDLERIVGQNSS